MNTQGKALTVFLVVVLVLLVSLTGIAIFFLQKENEMRKSTEGAVAKLLAENAQYDTELREARKKIFILEEKGKEADEKINGLLDDLEYQEGLHEQLKLDSIVLKDSRDSEAKAREQAQKDLIAARNRTTSLEAQLATAEQARVTLEAKVKDLEARHFVDEETAKPYDIVIPPSDIRPGAIIQVDANNDFVIFNLGRQDGIRTGMVMSVYRGRTYLGDIVVSRVQAEMSIGDFVPPLTSRRVRKNDTVTVKE